jgi:hypothetical protein
MFGPVPLVLSVRGVPVLRRRRLINESLRRLSRPPSVRRKFPRRGRFQARRARNRAGAAPRGKELERNRSMIRSAANQVALTPLHAGQVDA